MTLEAKLRTIADSVPGRLGLAVRDLASGETVLMNADDWYPMASVFKIPVLVELIRRVERGEISLTERVTLSQEMKSPGSGVLSELDPGACVTIKDLAMLMTIVSDNTAADYLVARLGGGPAVTRAMRELGLEGIEIGHDCLGLIMSLAGLKPEARSPETIAEMRARLENEDSLDLNNEVFRSTLRRNSATPRALLELLARLEGRTLLRPESCEVVLDILRRQQLNQRLPRFLPGSTKFAHKTGTIGGTRNDCGIMYLARGPVVVCAMIKDLPPGPEAAVAGDQALSEVGLAVYQAYNS